MSKLTPFDFIKDISHVKENIMKDDVDNEIEKQYNAFIVNRGFSYFMDTVIYANEMNIRSGVDAKLQFDFLINTVRQKKRYSKWHKAEQSDDIQIVKEYYGYNIHRAKEVLPLHTKEQLMFIREKLDKGGLKGE
jgi:cobyric acid synthase